MTRLSVALLAVAVAASSSSSSVIAQQRAVPNRLNDPGMPTVARMYILNSGADEAVPVILHGGSDVQPVTVMALPAVSLAAGTTVSSSAARQAWEYRQVTVPGGQDPSAALNAAGAEGWEAVSSSTSTVGLQVLMKRPH